MKARFATVIAVSFLAVPLLATPPSLPEASKLLAEEKWAEAATVLRRQLMDAPDDGSLWSDLGTALHEAGRWSDAAEAHARAASLGHQPGLELIRSARSSAAAGDLDAMRTRLAEAAGLGAPVLAIGRTMPELAAHEAVLETWHPCAAPEYHAFDFWIGEWDVFAPDGRKVGTNSIVPINDDCVLLESWVSARGTTGYSFNYYDRQTRLWNQFWIDLFGGSSPLSVGSDRTAQPITGGIVDGSMVLSSSSVTSPMNRIRWTPLEGNRVRQLWEQSGDGGKTWNVVFDGLYVPRSQRQK